MSRVLVLNATCEPINVTDWRRAVTLLFCGKAQLVEDAGVSVSGMPLPRVIKLSYYVPVPYMVPSASKANILRRDRHCCRYCGRKSSKLTLDHVMPRSRGGRSSWRNLVSACLACNLRKGNRTPAEAGMPLLGGGPPSLSRVEFEILFGSTGEHEAAIACWLKYLPEQKNTA